MLMSILISCGIGIIVGTVIRNAEDIKDHTMASINKGKEIVNEAGEKIEAIENREDVKNAPPRSWTRTKAAIQAAAILISGTIRGMFFVAYSFANLLLYVVAKIAGVLLTPVNRIAWR